MDMFLEFLVEGSFLYALHFAALFLTCKLTRIPARIPRIFGLAGISFFVHLFAKDLDNYVSIPRIPEFVLEEFVIALAITVALLLFTRAKILRATLAGMIAVVGRWVLLNAVEAVYFAIIYGDVRWGS